MIQLTIMMEASGEVKVSGPLHEKVLCYGLLEQAKDLIRDYKPSPILKPDLGVIPMNGHNSKPN